MLAPPKPIRALALLSGGLDSQLAVHLLQEQGIEVHGLTFRSIFFSAHMAEQAVRHLRIPLLIEDFTPTILELIAHPRHGFGAGLNPCIDCHIAMVRRAGELMRERGFHFICTGEVLNQRPMSQHLRALQQVAAESGLGDYLLRPLSAQLLPETEPERNKWVARERLLALHGRNRKPQMALARDFGITDYPQPAGGCLLTDPLYGKRLKDLKIHEGLDNAADILRLRVGRHFRLGAARLIIGRNQADNQFLEKNARPTEWLIKARDVVGPIAVFPTSAREQDVRQAAAMCARYADCPPGVPVIMQACQGDRELTFEVTPADPAILETLRL